MRKYKNINKIYYFLYSIIITKYFAKIKLFFIYIDSFVIKTKFFFKFIKLSYKILMKFKFKVFNNILNVVYKVVFCKSSKLIFVVNELMIISTCFEILSLNKYLSKNLVRRKASNLIMITSNAFEQLNRYREILRLYSTIC